MLLTLEPFNYLYLTDSNSLYNIFVSTQSSNMIIHDLGTLPTNTTLLYATSQEIITLTDHRFLHKIPFPSSQTLQHALDRVTPIHELPEPCETYLFSTEFLLCCSMNTAFLFLLPSMEFVSEFSFHESFPLALHDHLILHQNPDTLDLLLFKILDESITVLPSHPRNPLFPMSEYQVPMYYTIDSKKTLYFFDFNTLSLTMKAVTYPPTTTFPPIMFDWVLLHLHENKILYYNPLKKNAALTQIPIYSSMQQHVTPQIIDLTGTHGHGILVTQNRQIIPFQITGTSPQLGLQGQKQFQAPTVTLLNNVITFP